RGPDRRRPALQDRQDAERIADHPRPHEAGQPHRPRPVRGIPARAGLPGIRRALPAGRADRRGGLASHPRRPARAGRRADRPRCRPPRRQRSGGRLIRPRTFRGTSAAPAQSGQGLHAEERPMSRRFHYGPWLAIAAVVAAGALLWKFYPRQAPADVVVPEPEPVAMVEQAPPVQHPIDEVPVLPEEAPAEPLPALADSDGAALAVLAELLGEDVTAFLRGEFLFRYLVATIDNLPRSRMAPPAYAGKPLAGGLVVGTSDGRHWLDEANFARYEVPVRLLEAVDARALVSAYVRFYPLFQQAYRELEIGR